MSKPVQATRLYHREYKKLEYLLTFRNLKINAQLDFEKDLICLRHLNAILNRRTARKHNLIYSINLGYIDGHIPDKFSALVFNRGKVGVMAITAFLKKLNSSSTSMEIKYRRGCLCHGMDDWPIRKEAIKQIKKSCEFHGLDLHIERAPPNEMPRWVVLKRTGQFYRQGVGLG
jgi:hypothetical protein